MDFTIFYSWQSDLPNKTNRGFIQDTLEKAIKEIQNDNSIEVEPVIDRDTRGVPGSPNIANTIFEKIEQCQVFVCDVSIINQGSDKRLTPNPNILIELGYAMKTLGDSRIILIMNSAFGEVEKLPFDLRMKRVNSYKMPEDCQDKSTERAKLQNVLKNAIIHIVKDIKVEESIVTNLSISEKTIYSIENNQSDKLLRIQEFIDYFIEELDKINPDFSQVFSPAQGDAANLLIESINLSEKLIYEFSLVTKSIVIMGDLYTLRKFYKIFEKILIRYNFPRGFSGTSKKTDFDFYKFIGHETFVILFSFLLREEKWDFISDLLEDDFFVENRVNYDYSPRNSLAPSLVPFTYLYQLIDTLEVMHRYNLNTAKYNHSYLLYIRHTESDLTRIVSMQDFMDADCFLFLRSVSLESKKDNPQWFPQSNFYMKQPPTFVVKAIKIKYANELLDPLMVSDLTQLRDLFKKSEELLNTILRKSIYISRHYPFGDNFDSNKIGTKN